ncbi:MAG: zinc ribbon domain-containing protein [Roseiflexaceae bacterium]
MSTRCSGCGAEIPADGRFCIECGQPAPEAATGATRRIATAERGPTCPGCDTPNPQGARFCVLCGHTLAAQPTLREAAPRAPAPPAPAAPDEQPGWGQRPNPAAWGSSGGLFLIGLAVLAFTGWWWPGILVLLGLTSLASSAAAGRPRYGMYGAFWMFGLAIIAAFNWWWPGILVLVGVMAILSSEMSGGFKRRRRR